MKRWRVLPGKHIIETTLGQREVDEPIRVYTNRTSLYEDGEMRFYVDAIDELDAWKQYLQWQKEQTK